MKKNNIPRNEYIRKPVGKTNPYKNDVIYDPMGQWKYPGQITKIPSNQITMQGVPYPVYGEDNLGYSQMMYPGMNYTFPGQYVTEIPMAQKGKEVKKRSTLSYLNPYNWGVSDYSNIDNFSKAYEAAKKAGEDEFMWGDTRYSTKYAGTPRQEVGKYGVKGKPIHPMDIAYPTQTNLYPYFGRFLPGHIASENPELGGLSVNYGPEGNDTWGAGTLFDNRPGEKQYYSYGVDADKFYKTVLDLPVGNKPNALLISGVDPKDFPSKMTGESTWNLFTNNCADNVCDAFGIPRSKGIQTPSGAMSKIKEKYPTLEVTGRTYPDYLELINKLKESTPDKILQQSKNLIGISYSPDLKDIAPEFISLIQNALHEKGYELPKSKSTHKEGTFDGILGQETKTALEDWQRKNKKAYGGWLDKYQKKGEVPAYKPKTIEEYNFRKKMYNDSLALANQSRKIDWYFPKNPNISKEEYDKLNKLEDTYPQYSFINEQYEIDKKKGDVKDFKDYIKEYYFGSKENPTKSITGNDLSEGLNKRYKKVEESENKYKKKWTDQNGLQYDFEPSPYGEGRDGYLEIYDPQTGTSVTKYIDKDYPEYNQTVSIYNQYIKPTETLYKGSKDKKEHGKLSLSSKSTGWYDSSKPKPKFKNASNDEYISYSHETERHDLYPFPKQKIINPDANAPKGDKITMESYLNRPKEKPEYMEMRQVSMPEPTKQELDITAKIKVPQGFVKQRFNPETRLYEPVYVENWNIPASMGRKIYNKNVPSSTAAPPADFEPQFEPDTEAAKMSTGGWLDSYQPGGFNLAQPNWSKGKAKAIQAVNKREPAKQKLIAPAFAKSRQEAENKLAKEAFEERQAAQDEIDYLVNSGMTEKEAQEYINTQNAIYSANEKQVYYPDQLKEYTPLSPVKKALNIAANPVDAFKQYNKYGYVADNYSDSDLFSPTGIMDLAWQFGSPVGRTALIGSSGYDIPRNIREGDYLSAGLNVLDAAPALAGALSKYGKPALQGASKLANVSGLSMPSTIKSLPSDFKDALKAGVQMVDEALVTPIQFRKEIKELRKLNKDYPELFKTPEGRRRLEALGIDADIIDMPNLTFKPYGGGYYHSFKNTSKKPIINIDFRQINKAKSKGYQASPKTVYEHELGHHLQREADRKNYLKELADYEKNNLENETLESAFLKPTLESKPTIIDKDLANIKGRLGIEPIEEITSDKKALVRDAKTGQLRRATFAEKSKDYFNFKKENERLPHLREFRNNMLEAGIIQDQYQPIIDQDLLRFLNSSASSGDRISSFVDPRNKYDLFTLRNNLNRLAGVTGAGYLGIQALGQSDLPQEKTGGWLDNLR